MGEAAGVRLGDAQSGLRRGPRPVVDQVGGVESADPRGEVPSSCCGIGGTEGAVGFGKHTDAAAGEIAISEAGAVHIHVAEGHVVKDATAGDSISIR